MEEEFVIVNFNFTQYYPLFPENFVFRTNWGVVITPPVDPYLNNRNGEDETVMLLFYTIFPS